MIQSYSGVSQCDLLSDKIDTFKTTKDGNHHCPPRAQTESAGDQELFRYNLA